jgi:hypothetical protein
VALDGAPTFKFGRYHGGIPMAAIAIDLQVVTGHASGNQGFELFSGHKFVYLFAGPNCPALHG